MRDEDLRGRVEQVQVVDDEHVARRDEPPRQTPEHLEVGHLLPCGVGQVLDDQGREGGEGHGRGSIASADPPHRGTGPGQLLGQGAEEMGAAHPGRTRDEHGTTLERVGAEPLQLLVASEGRHAWER